MSAEVPVIEDVNVGRSTKPPIGNSTLAERLLAGLIDDYGGPIVREEDRYEGRGKEHALAMSQAHVYRLLTDLSYHDLELHFRNCPRVRHLLGFEGVPDHTTFSKSWNEQFREETRLFLKEYCTWIQEEMRRVCVAEFEPYLPSDETTTDRDLPKIPDEEIDDAIRNVRGILFQNIDFGRGENTTHGVGDLVNICTDACNERKAFNTVIDENGHEPALKTLMNALKQRSGDGWKDVFEAINERLIETAKRSGMLNRKMHAYIDITIIPFYPQEAPRPDAARGNEKKAGTMHGFHFGTLVAHDPEHDKDFVVGMSPYTPDMKPFDLVKDLMRQAHEHCQFKSIQMDSEFCTARICRMLQRNNIDVTARLKRRGDRLKGILAAMTEEYDDFDDYRLGNKYENSINVRVVTEPDWNNADRVTLEKEVKNAQTGLDDFGSGNDTEIVDIDGVDSDLWQCRRPYATTIKDREPREVMRIFKKRWRVENSYADVKRALLGKTQSRDHGVRVFLFWLSNVIYNAWMLTRTFLRMDFPNHRPQDRPPVTASSFIKKILQLEYG